MRAALEASPTSAASLSEIDGALFMVNLDSAAPEGVHDTCLSMLMGNGTDRWFDKSFQLVVTANGKAALNFEHAWGDGVWCCGTATRSTPPPPTSPSSATPSYRR